MNNDIKSIIDKPKRKYTKKKEKKQEEIKVKKKRGRRKKGEELLIEPEKTIDYIIKHWPYIGATEIKTNALLGLSIQRDIKENYSVLDKIIYNKKVYYYDNRNIIVDTNGQFVGFFINQYNETKKIYFLEPVMDNRTYDEVMTDIKNNKKVGNFIKIDNNIIIKREAKKRGRKKGKRKQDDKFLMKPEDTIDYLASCWPKLGIINIKNKVVSGMKIEKEKGTDNYVLDKYIHNDNIYWIDNKNTVLDNNAKFVGFIIDNNDGTKNICFIESSNDNRTYKKVINDIENKN